MATDPSELPYAAAARRLWIDADSPLRGRLPTAAPWVARWASLSRGAPVAIAWDGSDEAHTAVWVATRMGLAVTVVGSVPRSVWQDLDDQSVTWGGSLVQVQQLPAGQTVVRPAA